MPSNLTRNAVAVASSRALSALLGFAIATWIARSLGEDDFGRYSLAVAWTVTVIPLAEIGLNTLVMRDAASGGRAAHLLRAALTTKLAVGLPIALLLIAAAPWAVGSAGEPAVDALRAGAGLLLATLFYSAFCAVLRADGREGALFALNVGGQSLLLAGVVWLCARGAGPALLVAWAGVAKALQAVASGVAWRSLRGESADALPEWPRLHDIVPLARRGLPFAAAGVVATLSLRLGTLVLGLLAGPAPAALYAAAHRVVELARFLPGAWQTTLLPAIAQRRASGLPTDALLRRGRVGLAGVALATVALAGLAGGALLAGLFGESFRAGASTFVWLALALLPGLQNEVVRTDLYARGEERFALVASLPGLAAQAALAFALVPERGAAGAAIALLAGELVTFAIYAAAARRRAGSAP